MALKLINLIKGNKKMMRLYLKRLKILLEIYQFVTGIMINGSHISQE